LGRSDLPHFRNHGLNMFPGAGLWKIQVLWEVTLVYLISCIFYSIFEVFIPWLRLLFLSWDKINTN